MSPRIVRLSSEARPGVGSASVASLVSSYVNALPYPATVSRFASDS